MLSKLIFNKTVHIKVLNIDQYLRTQNLNLNVGLIKINADYKGFQNEFYSGGKVHKGIVQCCEPIQYKKLYLSPRTIK